MDPLHIAICEDSTEEQKNLLAILEQSEIPTVTATFANGEDFLREYRQGKYDLLLMDIYMGGMTGVEVVTNIRKTDETLIVAFITSSADHTLVGYRLNAIKYIEKPVKEKDVWELLAFARILYVEQREHTLYLHLTRGDEE